MPSNALWQDLVRRTWDENKPLTITGILMLVSFAATLIGILVDPRIITGQPAWVKPSKFAISIAIYSFTFVWMLSFLRGFPRVKWALAWITVSMFWVEFVLIGGQALRGTSSHFNATTPFDAAVFSIMGTAITILWFAAFFLAILLMRQQLEDRAFAWSLRLGLVGAIIGMAMAFAMTSPTPEQLETMDGFVGNVAGTHSVGVEDGGPGIPYLGWSTEAGDLRVAHFIGLHAMQAIPLLAMALSAFGVAAVRRLRLVWTGAFVYIGITFLTLWQALRGQSVIAPDLWTGAAFAGLLVVGALGVVWAAQAPTQPEIA
jgi:hypothetical protein